MVQPEGVTTQAQGAGKQPNGGRNTGPENGARQRVGQRAAAAGLAPQVLCSFCSGVALAWTRLTPVALPSPPLHPSFVLATRYLAIPTRLHPPTYLSCLSFLSHVLAELPRRTGLQMRYN